jgi:short-subunit dehydrogenase
MLFPILKFLIYIIFLIIKSIIILLLTSVIFYLYTYFYFKRKKIPYENSHILIFGGSSGLGESIAILLSKKGNNISIASRSEKKLKETKEKILKQNPNSKCEYYICDMTITENIKETLINSIKKFGFPKLIINSVGIAHPGFIEDISYEQYEKDMNLNYFSSLKMMKEFKKIYDEEKSNEKIDIVFIGSVLGLIGSIGYSCYCPTKYALKGLIDSLRFEFLNENINFHYYAPSNMDTPGLKIENENKPLIVSQMENNVKTISSEDAAYYLLCNLDKYVITTEPDLELLKNSCCFMGGHSFLDFFLVPIAVVGVFFSRLGIEKNIRVNYENKKKRMKNE